jgi:hypothetical protein
LGGGGRQISHRPTASDPDYELPRGALTETDIYTCAMHEAGTSGSAGGTGQYDRYGFRIVPAAGAGAGDGPAGSGGGNGDEIPSRLDRRQAAKSRGAPAAAGRGAAGIFGGFAGAAGFESFRQARRIGKWSRMLGPGGTELAGYMRRRGDKLKRRVRKGVPPQFRGLVWQLLSGECAVALWHL